MVTPETRPSAPRLCHSQALQPFFDHCPCNLTLPWIPGPQLSVDLPPCQAGSLFATSRLGRKHNMGLPELCPPKSQGPPTPFTTLSSQEAPMKLPHLGKGCACLHVPPTQAPPTEVPSPPALLLSS